VSTEQGNGRRPRLGLAIVTCMDARIDPFALWGLGPGDAHVLRNAGGIATDDVLRSLALSSTLGTREARVVGHTDCGLDDLPDHPPVEERVRATVRAIAESPLLPDGFAASGFVYDVTTRELRAVTP
jgi:carbonic anhydrase